MNTKFPCIIIICIFAINLPSQLFLHCHLKPHKFFTSFGLCIFLHLVYSRSQNNINVVYCNYKEITIRYREITEHNFPHSIPNAHAGIICDPLNENLTIVCIIHVLRKFQLKCMNRVKMCATKIILHKYLTIQ